MSDFLGALGMGLIVLGVALSLARDMRHRFNSLQLFFNSLDQLSPYASFFGLGCVLLGLFLMFVALFL